MAVPDEIDQPTDPIGASEGSGTDPSTVDDDGDGDEAGTDDGPTTPVDGADEGDGGPTTPVDDEDEGDEPGAPKLLQLGEAQEAADGVTSVVNRGQVWNLEGRLDRSCDDLELRAGTSVLAEGAAGEDGVFALEVPTIDLPPGEQTVTLYCGTEPEPLGETTILIAQQVDSSGGPAEAGVLLCVLLFFLLMVLLGVSVPLPRADAAR